jgi:hypothetical protein
MKMTGFLNAIMVQVIHLIAYIGKMILSKFYSKGTLPDLDLKEDLNSRIDIRINEHKLAIKQLQQLKRNISTRFLILGVFLYSLN